ncbi:unnamed protein product [Allacma fusca]|uniref:1-acyl-sn-glycerol-3-phosphate acyltransferase n=1 Tax=Allacma fusca TaxID=39272 RepID=A0A8J2JS25_9HEXA|nr:unnamed protein product [Allacma fusca]
MSPRFRYHFKFAIFGIAVSVVSLIIIPVAMFRPRDVRNSVMSTPLMNWISKLLGIVWELRGEENLAGDFACVVVCNHQSFLDFLGKFYNAP